ncbi:MAG: SRPBCC family protein [Deltaproteobacteria bacterium]|nr:SRPBCC family protein [Deltaproteobacteria bacterium]
MIEVSLEREFAVDAKKLWAILADFADISWIPGLEKVELEGEGVGMIRHVTAPGMAVLHERMDAIDREKMILDYSVPTVEYLRVKNHRAQARVVALEGRRCRLIWSCESEPDGVSDAQATTNCQAFYEMAMGWIGDALAR